MFSLGMLAARAVSIARRSRGLPAGSPPPCRAATVISRISLVQLAARLLSVIAFLRLICFHLLCPATGHLHGVLIGIGRDSREPGIISNSGPFFNRTTRDFTRRDQRERRTDRRFLWFLR